MLFYFGGWRSTQADVSAWAASVWTKTGLPVEAFPYPVGASSSRPLERWTRSAELADRVRDGDLIVGHSSGCAIANDVARCARTRFRLLALDGFAPQGDFPFEVWSARGLGGQFSLNFHSLQGNPAFRVYDAAVSNLWPLHFSLVNLAVDDNYATIANGYRNCDANLKVLGL